MDVCVVTLESRREGWIVSDCASSWVLGTKPRSSASVLYHLANPPTLGDGLLICINIS